MNRFRRVLIRWEKKVENYFGMLHFVWRLDHVSIRRPTGIGSRANGILSLTSLVFTFQLTKLKLIVDGCGVPVVVGHLACVWP